MEEKENANDSVCLIPDNYSLVVLSDDEEQADEETVKVTVENSRIKQELLECGDSVLAVHSPDRKKTFDRKLNNKIKKEKCEYEVSVANTPEKTTDLKRKKTIDGKVNCKKIKTEKNESEMSDSKPVKTEIIEPETSSSSKIKKERSDSDSNALKTAGLKRKKTIDRKVNSKKIKTEANASTLKPVKTELVEPSAKIKEEIETKPVVASYSASSSSTFNDEKQPKLGSGVHWEASMLAWEANIPVSIAKNVIVMLKNDCTVPFMARYRRDMTGNMEADDLRRLKDCFHHIKNLETKALTAIKQIKAAGKLTPKLESMIYSVKSTDELDFIYAPYKKGSSKTKAERAKVLGLEQAAVDVLEGRISIEVESYVDPTKEGLKNRNEVIEGIQNIIADIFAKDEDMLTYLSEIEKNIHITIKSHRVKSSSDKASKTKNEQKPSNEDAEKKFELYYDFSANVNNIQPHQILALNRGESLKILSVKLVISDWFERTLYKFFERKWMQRGFGNDLRKQMLQNSFRDSYSRLISPFVIRRTKSALNRKAQFAAIESFASNLKNLLQTPPVKGCSILGVDPGFRHGSKFALISKNGDVLWTEILSFGTGYISTDDEKYMKVIRKILIQHRCELVAIGNGTGCRNMEKVFSTYIKQRFFEPDLNVQYTIVNERGASIYSCSSTAKEEFPDLDPNLVSAVFIARTLQDPLSEFVKVEPKHLGVGMYQHDMPEKQLNSALDEVVEQCVSFVGVDVNTASIHLLKRISGLGLVRAKNIIEWRQCNGLFKNRQQLCKVKGIGQKTFEQCSGFVRIYPCDAQNFEIKTEKKAKSGKANETYYPLDRTCIHPESYKLTEQFIKKCDLDIRELGSQTFIDKVKRVVNEEGISKIAADLKQTESSITLIADALVQPSDYDYRNQFSKPVFRQGFDDINSIKPGMEITGVVGNVTNFGAFVDIGVGKDGLIHISKMNGQKVQVGDRVEVKILDVRLESKRITLFLLKKY